MRIGLSPLARGTRSGRLRQGFKFRFIPAGAGNTPGFTVVADNPEVYPRWRGEHRMTSKKCGKTCGLSPLARGTLYLDC
ncbi:Domain of uncharacterised function (DUF2825) [Salmonella enterica]|nr:Domain of uncharacterised function (DUF2825) [Salmonella enterica]